MLRDIIRDFFVQYIFGGITSTGYSYKGYIGVGFSDAISDVSDLTTVDYYVPFFGYADLDSTFEVKYIVFGDYLSTTFTIITFVILFIVACLFVRWCFRVFKGSWKWF